MLSRKYKNLTIYGPDPLERNEEGRFIHPMADIFPNYRAMIVGSGLHVTLAHDFMAMLAGERGQALEDEEEERIYEDLVAVILRGEHVVIRSMPDNMKLCFRAAELLEEAVPAEMIRFTGSRDPQVREAFKLRGESWKMTPRYFTVEEIISQIELSLVSVGTSNRYYYNMESGGRLITYQQFENIRAALRDYQEFSARIFEVLDLFQRRNKQYVRELDFFMILSDRTILIHLEHLVMFVKQCERWGEAEQKRAVELFDAVLAVLRESISPEFLRDNPDNPTWRTYMYSELNDIPPTEESILGVSEEFNMNIQWVPGCRIEHGRLIMDPHVDEPVASLLQDFFRFYGPLEYINLGQVMRSQSQKRAAGSYREVFIAVLRQKKSQIEQIRILRKVMRNTLYFLNHGFPMDKALKLCRGYLQYTFDRRELLSLLGVNTPPVNCLRRTERIPGLGEIPGEFFDRPYINGLATDKISYYFYENEGFVRAQAAFLGDAAALNLIVGRCNPDSGIVYFGDGDELLVFEKDKLVPNGVILADFTGTFADVVSPLERFAPFYENYVLDMLARVRIPGAKRAQILEIAELFIFGLEEGIERTRQLLLGGGSLVERIDDLLADRDVAVNPIRVKWDRVLERLRELDLEKFIEKFRTGVRRRVRNP